MKYLIASILVSAVLMTGCDSYVSSSEHQARLQMADYSGWLKAKADSRDRTIRQIGTVYVGRLGHGEETTIPLDITGAHDATVIAACDRACADLDLRIVTADGRLMELDEGGSEREEGFHRISFPFLSGFALRERAFQAASHTCSGFLPATFKT